MENGEDENNVNRRHIRVMAGSLEDLPGLSSKIVRIFTSSTFTDTTTERNALMQNVYPKLKEFCREQHGLEFQVVDMRWGVRDEATDDHMTTDLCMNEIDNCQRLSVGPNFVVFLGQKYGYRPIPTIILASELDMLRGVINDVPEDAQILDTWYQRDSNAVPPVYILQPISSILTNFNNKRMQRLMEQDQNTWWDTMGKLQKMFRKAAQVLFIARKMDRDQMHNYFMSVTEREVRRGVINAKGTRDHCLAYIRDIENMNLTALRFARNFVDMVGRDVDKEAIKLLSVLRDEILPTKLPDENTARFKVQWAGKEGVDRESHQDYLADFCDHFYHNIVKLIDRDMEANKKLSNDNVYNEVLQHLHACQNFCKIFQGREEVVHQIRDYIIQDYDEPLVLYGESGCGKTSLLAKAYSQVETWMTTTCSPVLLLRFLGTSPDSSTIIPMLTSVCQQIGFNYGHPCDDIPGDLSPLVQFFKNILNVATCSMPLVIFLDSLDQLSAADGAHSLSWLPVKLPPNVKIIVSTLPNYYGILETLQKMLPSEKNYVQVKPLGQNLGSTILTSWLKNANRTLNESQMKVVDEAIAKCNLPLFVKLVFDEVSKWKSYTSPKMTTLAHSIHASINKLYDRIESQHGKILVSHALGYITASKGGLSEAELEDLLSLDERVLNDVYQYHLPPVRRIPPLLWTRIRNDLPNYFSEREADGVNVIFWYHRQFIEASRERYFRNVNYIEEIHSQLADYFMGIWGGGKEKPFTYSELQRQRFCLDSTTGTSDRKVPEQPLYFKADAKVVRYNLRKLNELPFHLVRAHRYDDMYKEVLFNFRFLHSKLSCMPLQTVLADMEDMLAHQYDRDVKLLADALRLSASVLSRHPDMFGPQVIGRLLPYYNSHEKIQVLIKQCDSDGVEANALVPSYHCLHTPGGPLQFSLEGHPFAPFGVAITSDSKYLVSVSNVFIIWDLSTGDVFRQIVPGIQGIMQSLCISPNDKFAVGYTNNNQVVLCGIMTGDYKVLENVTTDNQDMVGVTTTSDHFLVWTAKEWHLYTTNMELVQKESLAKDNNTVINISLHDDKEQRVLVWKSDKPIAGVESDDDMTLEFHNSSVEDFYFHSAMAMTNDRSVIYACIAISDDNVACYKKCEDEWKYDRTLGSNFDKIFSLTLSPDEQYLVGNVALAYKVWDLKTNKLVMLKLPTGVRNIPTKNQLTSTIVFTKNNGFLVAGVRKNLYVWDTKSGTLIKTLDAHFGRIIALTAVAHGDNNKVVSSSIDKSIKVWNFDNILEDVHSIDRLEKPIESISLATNAYVGAATTRNCVGVWNLESGKLMKTLANSQRGSIVTHSAITADAKYVVSVESGNVLIWDVETEKVVKQEPQRDVQQMMLNDEDAKCVVISKVSLGKGKCVCRTVPNGETVYQFEFNMQKTFIPAVVTSDGLFLLLAALGAKNAEVLSLYHAKTGTHMYDMPPKYANFKPFNKIVPMPNDPHLVALIDEEKGNIWDVKKKSFVKSIARWNGVCTNNGKWGLFAPNRGGLDLLDLKHGRTIHTLLPKVAEGVFTNMTLFTRNDQHAVYYHSGRRSIRVFRVSDGKQIADYKAHAEIRAIASTQGGVSLVLGAVDGSVVVLCVADPTKDANKEFLSSLPSRQVTNQTMENMNGHAGGASEKGANGTHKFASVAHVARLTAKAKLAQKSRACVIS